MSYERHKSRATTLGVVMMWPIGSCEPIESQSITLILKFESREAANFDVLIENGRHTGSRVFLTTSVVWLSKAGELVLTGRKNNTRDACTVRRTQCRRRRRDEGDKAASRDRSFRTNPFSPVNAPSHSVAGKNPRRRLLLAFPRAKPF